jgi:lipoprotein-releasing system ATP-binding protein
MSSKHVLELRGLVRRFRTGTTDLLVLDEVDFEIGAGQIVGLVGPSGSGKSSLLHAAGLLEEPSAGDVDLDSASAWELDDSGRTALRRSNIGFVYQFHHLLPEFTALENAALPALIAGRSQSEAHHEARRLLQALGLEARLNHRPSQLSGGEQQRVAIARALVNRPLLVLADEPTGNLDPDTAATVFNELAHMVRSEGTSALIATHNYELARFMDRVVGLTHGKLIEIDHSKPIEPQLAAGPKGSVVTPAPEKKPRLYPWARFWAKQVDLSLHILLIGGFLSTLGWLAGVDRQAWAWMVWLVLMLSYPIVDAIFVSSTGGSIGRAIFRFSVLRRNGDKASFKTALARAWTCLFFGQGLWVVWPLTYWASYTNLTEYQASLWDRDAGTQVVHRGPKWWSLIVPIIYVAAAGVGGWFWAQDFLARLAARG